MTGEMVHVMMVDRKIKRAPIARINADIPYYLAVLETLRLLDPLFDLIIITIISHSQDIFGSRRWRTDFRPNFTGSVCTKM